MFNLLSTSRLRAAWSYMGRVASSREPYINCRNHPLPLTADFSVLLDSTSALVIGIAFAFVPASVIGWIVKERQIKVKHLQLISGVSSSAYWLSTWIWDFISFLLPSFLALIIFAIFDLQTVIGSNSGATFLNLLLYASSVISFAYCMSFFFDNHNTAQNLMLVTHYFMTHAHLLFPSLPNLTTLI
jgi:ATP-binding cassette subfamily A (ABC1) protein 3